MCAASALQKAIHARLTGDAELTALIGADGVCDRLLDRQRLPLVVIESIESRDRSTATEDGEEHWVTLVAWSKVGGHREAQTIAARLRALLHGADLPLDGFHLVSLLHRSTRLAREGTKALHKAEMRLGEPAVVAVCHVGFPVVEDRRMTVDSGLVQPLLV